MQKTIGAAWTARGRPPAGSFTKRTGEAWLRGVLAEAAAGTLSEIAPGRSICRSWRARARRIFRNHVLPHLQPHAREGDLAAQRSTRSGVADACAEYLRYLDVDRQRKSSTLRDYDSTVFHGATERRASCTACRSTWGSSRSGT